MNTLRRCCAAIRSGLALLRLSWLPFAIFSIGCFLLQRYGWAAFWCELAAVAGIGWLSCSCCLVAARADLLAAEARMQLLRGDAAYGRTCDTIRRDRAISAARNQGRVEGAGL